MLSLGSPGDSAGELHRIDLDAELPVALSRQPRLRIPFPDARMATLGSLALDPATHELFLGEENGSRIHRLSAPDRLSLYATGLRRLAGGGTIAVDRVGRLLVVDYVDRTRSLDEEGGPPRLEDLRDEDYRGPLVFRLDLDATRPQPRHIDRIAPLFPRAWRPHVRVPVASALIAVTATADGDVVLLSSAGEMFRLTPNGTLTFFVRLPAGHGQYNRTHMGSALDGSILVSGGFHVARIFRVFPDGRVATVVSHLADPDGIAVDAQGNLYVAESSLQRIIRLRLRAA